MIDNGETLEIGYLPRLKRPRQLESLRDEPLDGLVCGPFRGINAHVTRYTGCNSHEFDDNVREHITDLLVDPQIAPIQ
jgi:hypothetical protein